MLHPFGLTLLYGESIGKPVVLSAVGVNISPVVISETRFTAPPPCFSPAFIATFLKAAATTSVAG